MSGPPQVRRAGDADKRAVAGVLTDAFADEAGLNYWLRQGRAKDRARARFFGAGVGDAIHPKRELWIAETGGRPAGGAIWLAPGCKAYDFSGLREFLVWPLLLEISGLGGMRRALRLGQELASHHPKAPHAHLTFLGVATSAQGQGVGSAILKETLAPVDAAHQIAFLETSTERNVALYQRHGFEVTGETKLPGLHMWSMTRPAR